MINASALILAGGKNSRMNYQNKSFLKLGNEVFIEKLLRELCNFKQIIISSNDPEPYKHLGLEVVKDIYPDSGPLGGIYSGLTHSNFDLTLAVAFDMPFLTGQLLEYLYGLSYGYDGVVPRSGQFYQPLCAIYSKECLPYIEGNLKNGIRKITDFYSSVNIRYVNEKELKVFGEFENIFRNINTPEDYKYYCSKTG